MIRANKQLSILAGLSLIAMAGCTDPGQVGVDNNGYKKTKTGALAGGIVGAVTGILVSDDKAKGALIGGAVGAVGGAAIGNALDKQEAELRQQLGNDNIQITNTGDRLIVSMPQDILFAVDSYNVQPGLRSDLLTVAQNLQSYPNSNVQVVGHTDNTGEAGYNQQLSERRANAVADVLMNGGVAFERIQTFGRGEDQPVASNLTAEGQRQNRRVEIVILPTT
ncbi:MAG: OmpA family protein [Roseovarius sp.]|nr:OmpA family protein [Roseovarius sp.]